MTFSNNFILLFLKGIFSPFDYLFSAVGYGYNENSQIDSMKYHNERGNTKYYYYYKDHLGSVRAVMDGSFGEIIRQGRI